MSIEFLDEIVRGQKQGEARGLASICSSHPLVLKAAMLRAVRTGTSLLVESTCNQVNQFGGYTGMTPADFAAYVRTLADQVGLAQEKILLGGDHLGPSVWQAEPAESAMQKSLELVQGYVRAGYVKIHLDASMKLGDDDPGLALDVEFSARRAALLAQAAEQAHASLGSAPAPHYVIGSEVPIPGGAQTHEDRLQVTAAEDVDHTIEVTRAAFLRQKLERAWERVQAVVVQPGVEFGDDFVLDYQPEAAEGLVRFIETQPGMVFEAHSTDYQTGANLRRLVRDHFAILKVGPALTFAMREAIFALAWMEDELFPASERSGLIAALEQAMLREPRHWQKYYHGSAQEQAFARKYSLSDRSRYYWPEAQVGAALARLLAKLSSHPLPLALLSQFAPEQLSHIRDGKIENKADAILLDHIDRVLEDYQMEPVIDRK
jgi:D-tagatose-1,6-bisphosphate aldolase subunit GatZ/KbaZ